MASLGGLLGLEKLDMGGCRGDARTMERKVWDAIAARRVANPVAAAEVLEARAQALLDHSDELLRQVQALRREAAKILEEARKLRRQ